MDSPQGKTDVLAAAIRTFFEDDFESMDRLESGAEAITYEAYSGGYGKVCAKLFHARIAPNAPSQDNRREINFLLKHAFHPNIVRVLGFFAERDNSQGQLGYVMEFMAGGSLHSVIYSQVQYHEEQVYNWIIQAGRGLLYLHEAGIIHRDVKPKNMLLDKLRETLKLSDFGLAKALYSESRHFNGGTVSYMAPELIAHGGKSFGPPSDVYAMGISCWEMFHRRLPFGNHAEVKLLSKVVEGERPMIKDTLDADLSELLKRSWDGDAKKRCTIMEIVNLSKGRIESIQRQGNLSEVQPPSARRLPNPIESNETVIEEEPATLMEDSLLITLKEGNVPADPSNAKTIITKLEEEQDTLKDCNSPPVPLHKVVIKNNMASSENIYENINEHAQEGWSRTEQIWKGLFLTNFFFAMPLIRIDASLRALQLFVWKCLNDFKNWERGEKLNRSDVIMDQVFTTNAGEDSELRQYFEGELRKTIENIDFGIYPVYTKFALICYYNTQYFTKNTQEKIEHMDIMLINIIKLLEKRSENVTKSLSSNQFNCLLVGDGHINPEGFRTGVGKLAPAASDYLYRQNFHTLTIPKDEDITERIDLIWKKIDNIGKVHSIMLLLDDSKEYRKFGDSWEKLIPYTAAVLFHKYVKDPLEEKSINRQHLQRVFSLYAHNVYLHGSEQSLRKIIFVSRVNHIADLTSPVQRNLANTNVTPN